MQLVTTDTPVVEQKEFKQNIEVVYDNGDEPEYYEDIAGYQGAGGFLSIMFKNGEVHCINLKNVTYFTKTITEGI
jgi:hypothetical protein